MDDPMEHVRSELERLVKERDLLASRLDRLNAEIADLETTLRVLQRVGSRGRDDSALSFGFKPPSTEPTKTDVIIEILKAHPQGLAQPEVRRIAQESYGVEINTNTTTVTLSRLKRQGRVSLDDHHRWFYVTHQELAIPSINPGSDDAPGPPLKRAS